MKKLLDIKTIFIIILGSLLIIAILVNRKNDPKKYDDKIKDLHAQNDILLHNNDSLNAINKSLDKYIKEINTQLVVNTTLLTNTQLQLDNLNKRRNEIPSIVNRLSANGVANAFTDHLDKRTKSSSIR